MLHACASTLDNLEFVQTNPKAPDNVDDPNYDMDTPDSPVAKVDPKVDDLNFDTDPSDSPAAKDDAKDDAKLVGDEPSLNQEKADAPGDAKVGDEPPLNQKKDDAVDDPNFDM